MCRFSPFGKSKGRPEGNCNAIVSKYCLNFKGYNDEKVECANFAHCIKYEISIYGFEKKSVVWDFRTVHKWIVATCSKMEQVAIQNARVL